MNNYAILSGVGQRNGDQPILTVTASDAQAVAAQLIKRCDLSSSNTTVLVNKKASKQGLLSALDELIEQTRTEKADTVWVYFSGHGQKTADGYYLVCHDENLSGAEFVEKLQAIQTDKMVILLDCCHAGGITTTNIPFDATALLTQTNRVVISSSDAQQASIPGKPYSLFTYALIEGLAGVYLTADAPITVFDLAMYLREKVYTLSKRQQQPQLDVLKNAQTQNFAVANGKTDIAMPPFRKDFTLKDWDDNIIDTNSATEKDETYRQQFQWLNQTLQVSLQGNDNIVVQGINNSTITINTASTDSELLELIKQQSSQIQNLISLFQKQQNPIIQQMGDRLEKSASPLINMKKLNIFISYSHADMAYKQKLETAFAVQIRLGKITLWDDQKMIVGSEWKKEIFAHLQQSDIIILLISADFFASDFIWDEELPLIQQRYNQQQAKVVPILLRPCMWQDTPYSQIQAVPTNPNTGKLTPISQWTDKDEAWTVVTTHIMQLVEEMQKLQPINTSKKITLEMNELKKQLLELIEENEFSQVFALIKAKKDIFKGYKTFEDEYTLDNPTGTKLKQFKERLTIFINGKL